MTQHEAWTKYMDTIASINRRHLETGYLTRENCLRYGPEKEWLIFHNDLSGDKFRFVHQDYDGAEDANDDRWGTGRDEHDCILQINEKILEELTENNETLSNDQ